MITEQNIGIYLNTYNNQVVEQIIKFFSNSTLNVINVHLFYDSDIVFDNYNIACLPSFYMPFYKQTIVFTNINDYIENYNDIISKDIYLISTIDEIKNYHIDKKIIEKLNILKLENGNIYAIR